MNASKMQPAGYTGTHKWIHWLTAIAVLVALPLGIIIGNAPEGSFSSATQDTLYNAHRSFGMLVLALAVLRVISRARNGTPPPAASLTKFERIASVSAHHLLYILIFLVPLLGWLGTALFGAPITVFHLFTIPPGLPTNQPLASWVFLLHQIGAILMTLIVAAHVAGAVKHAFKRDGVFSRMMPGG
jgi:cytochrome b561